VNRLKDDVRGPLALMEQVFDAEGRLADEYPLVFHRGFEGRLVALDEGEVVVSSCAVLPRSFLVDGERVDVGLIGSVATAPKRRGRGLASHVLTEAERWLAERGALFSVLWADDARFYVMRGYRPIGGEIVVPIERTVAAALPRWPEVRLARQSDGARIHALYASQSIRVDRTEAETRALLACPGMLVLVAERAGEPCAYVCIGRGRDLGNALHEWAGEPDAVLGAIGSAAAMLDCDPLFLMAPRAPSVVLDALRAAGAAPHQGHLGLGKLLSGDGPAHEAAALLARAGGGDASYLGVVRGERRFRWTGPAGSIELDEHGLLDILVGATDDSSVLDRARRATGLDAARLPLPLFAWGLDSI
jgi:GNAT superfamily N-acetyltransferase